jgi:hypothetical protein
MEDLGVCCSTIQKWVLNALTSWDYIFLKDTGRGDIFNIIGHRVTATYQYHRSKQPPKQTSIHMEKIKAKQ